MASKPLTLFALLLLLVTAACATATIPEEEFGSGEAAQVDPSAADDNDDEKAPKCSGSKTKCEGECVDLKTATNHCGACGSPCAGGSTCVNGFCSSEGSCAANRLACGTKCVDPQVDNENCGACGNSCAGGAACVKGGCPGEMRVRVLIDGQSQLVFSGAKVKWHVVKAAAPGRWDGRNDATFLSGTPWIPVWPNGGDNRDCNCDSQLSPDVATPLKAVDQIVTMTKIEGRGQVTITEQPSALNGYSLKVDFNDPPGGAAWFEIVLKYVAAAK
jgi:hypothetical protein